MRLKDGDLELEGKIIEVRGFRHFGIVLITTSTRNLGLGTLVFVHSSCSDSSLKSRHFINH